MQATFVGAIEGAAGFDPDRRVLPWMLGILANNARRHRRQQRREIDGEQLSQKAPVDPLTAASDAEFREFYNRALEQLPEVYRQVLVLHLQHGLTAAEVGEALGRPAGTVRTQVVRGMEVLRKALPVSFAGGMAVAVGTGRGLAAVRAAVLQRVGGLTTAGASSSVLGFLGWMMVMKKTSSLVALLFAAVAFLLWSGSGGPEREPVVGGAQDAASQLSARLGDESSATPESSRQSGDTVLRRSQASVTGSLKVEVRYRDGSPAVGVVVTAGRVLGRLHEREMGPEAACNGDGVAMFSGLPSGRVDLWTDRGTLISPVVEATVPGRAEIILPPGITVVGQVVDVAGRPVAGAQIFVDAPDFPHDRGFVLTVSNAEGGFALRDVHADYLRVWAMKPGFQSSNQVEHRSGPGSEFEASLVLRGRGESLHGVVRARDGSPLSGADVHLLLPAQAQTDMRPRRGRTCFPPS